MFQHSIRHRVAWGDTDAAGIVYYPNYYRWFDLATHELMRGAGFALPEMKCQGFSLPLIETHARFHAALRYDDAFIISSSVVELRTRACRIEHRIQHNDTLAAEGYEVRMWVRLLSDGGLEPLPLPPQLRSALLGET